MDHQNIGLPAGFRDVLFEEANRRRAMEASAATLFAERGYGEITPAAVEFFDLYRRGHQGVQERAIRFLDRDDSLLALRADFTPAIARIVSSRMAKAIMPLRIWYAGSVFRRTDPSQGRFHQVTQIGAELIGDNGTAADVELLTLALEVLTSVGVTDVQVHINHAGVFGGLVHALDVDEAGRELVMTTIDRKDARGLAARLETLGVAESLRKQVRILSRSVGGTPMLQDALASLTIEESRAAIGELLMLAKELDRWKGSVVFDLTEIDEMEYYTGLMFRLFSPALSRELGQGGRYDELLAEFGAPMPAVGFSFSVDSLVGAA